MCIFITKKGQKFKKYSDKIKQQIILDLQKGLSHKYISKKYNIPLGTIDTWTNKLYHSGNYPGYGQKRGRPKEKDVHGLIIHSDQGLQYTSYAYKAIFESNGIQISMSRKGTPIDDSPIESWYSLLKKETLYNNNIISLQEYIQLVEKWILFYNATRLKSKVKKREKIHKKRKIIFSLFNYYFFYLCLLNGVHIIIF